MFKNLFANNIIYIPGIRAALSRKIASTTFSDKSSISQAFFIFIKFFFLQYHFLLGAINPILSGQQNKNNNKRN